MNAYMTKRILILGGSNEAFILAEKLTAHSEFNCISSLAGRTSIPRKPTGPYRTGGFGGPNGLVKFIQTETIDAIIDATHPFARNISQNAAEAAQQTNCPLLHIWRHPWLKQTGDNWIVVDNMAAAATILSPNHNVVFLTIGRLELGAFINRTDINFLSRAIEPAQKTDPHGRDEDQWPENFRFIYAKGPFTYNDEKEIITKNNIKTIVTKNSGGDKARAKLDVARDLNLTVIMIKRPNQPSGPKVATAKDAIQWIEENLIK